MLTSDGMQEVWNINILIMAWLGFGIGSYLVGSLVMASEIQMKGVVTYGVSNSAYYSRRVSSKESSNESTVLHGNGNSATEVVSSANNEGIFLYSRSLRGENCSAALWFMMISFSSALAAFAISTRVGDACIGVLSETPYCKRSSLGGGIGISCALLACVALSFYRMDQIGSFDHWEARREKFVSRVDAILSMLTLVLYSVNMGYGANPSGPSTEMGNLYIASTMGVILSLMLCEQMMNRSVLWVLPSSPETTASDGKWNEHKNVAIDDRWNEHDNEVVKAERGQHVAKRSVLHGNHNDDSCSSSYGQDQWCRH